MQGILMRKLFMLVNYVIPTTHQEELFSGTFAKTSLGVLMTTNLMKGTYHTGYERITKSHGEC